MTHIWNPIAAHVAERPDEVALKVTSGSLSWAQLAQLVMATERQFHDAGVRAGQRVGITLRDQLLHLLSCLALARIGAAQVAIPASTSETLVAQTIKQLGLAHIVVGPSIPVPCATNCIVLKAVQATAGDEKNCPAIDGDGRGIFLLLQSSGTTGDPKFAELSHAMSLTRFERYMRYFETTSNDTFWPASRLDFVVAKQRTLHALQAGAAVCLTPTAQIDAQTVATLNAQNVTLACSTPAHLDKLASLETPAPNLPKLRAFEVRSATVSGTLKEKFTRACTPHLYVAYATNEAEVVSLATPQLLSQVENTVGVVTQDMAVEVVDVLHRPVPNGEIGLIRIRGAGVIEQYLDNPAATAASFRDGWFYPGDVGHFEGDALVFLGRDDDLMIYDGMNIYPVEIENVLAAHPAVAEVAAFPLKSERYQDVPAAAVVLSRPCDWSELRAYCAEHLGSKQPRTFQAFKSFPRNPMGKVLKRVLRDQVSKAVAASGHKL